MSFSLSRCCFFLFLLFGVVLAFVFVVLFGFVVGTLVLFLCLLLGAVPAFAQVAQYGYVVGTLEPSKSFLEKLDAPDKGKYLHYHIFLLTAANVEYEVVIDVNDV